MRYLITGTNGMLGYDIKRELNRNGYNNIWGPSSKIMDITNERLVASVVQDIKPDVIFHCAAYTNVEGAEIHKDECFKINVDGTRNLVTNAEKVNAKIFYISTDYVFDGNKITPYEINDMPNPQNIYGMSKYRGELETLQYFKSFIIRVSWLFGLNGSNFVRTMLRQLKNNDFMRVINDQVSSPTYTLDIAKLLVKISLTDKYGIYHLTNSGYASWYDFAKYIFDSYDIKIKIEPVTSEEFETKAKRPKNSRLSNKSLINNGFDILPSWQDAIDRYIDELRDQEILVKNKRLNK